MGPHVRSAAVAAFEAYRAQYDGPPRPRVPPGVREARAALQRKVEVQAPGFVILDAAEQLQRALRGARELKELAATSPTDVPALVADQLDALADQLAAEIGTLDGLRAEDRSRLRGVPSALRALRDRLRALGGGA